MLRIVLFALFAAIAMPFAAMAQDAALPQDAPTTEAQKAAIDALLGVLQDDATRQALIEQLQRTEGETPTGPDTPDETEQPTFAQSLASATAGIVAEGASSVQQLVTVFTNLNGLTNVLLLENVTPERLWGLLATIVATIVAYAFLRRWAARFVRRWDTTPGTPTLSVVLSVIYASIIRLLAVAVAWIAGYLVATFLASTNGMPAQSQALYLNAFAVFGAYRVILKAIFSQEAETQPSLSRLAPRAQELIYGHLRLVGGLATQTGLFIVPLVQHWMGFVEARSTRIVLVTITFLVMLRAIQVTARAIRLSRGHRVGLQGASGTGAAVAKGMDALWARAWPVLAVLYSLTAWFMAVLRPNFFADVVIGGTLYSLAAVLLWTIGARIVELASHNQASLAHHVSDIIPFSGSKIALLARVLAWIFAVILYVVAFFLVLHGWGVMDTSALLAQETVQTALWGLASALLILIVAMVVWIGVSSWIDFELNARLSGPNVSARKRTLLALFRSAFTITVATITAMLVLSQLGVNIGPLLAGAGVIGLAVGFGSQKLVQDIITGAFIQIENAINEGDVVQVAGITGGVEKISIRSVRLRTLDGTAHVIPFSSVDVVSNLTRDFGFHVAEIGAAYKEDVADVKAAMEEAFDRLKGEFGADILEPLEMHGVTQLADSAVVVRARIKTRAGQQWGIGRTYTELVKKVMDERGIEIPFPHRQIVLPEALAKPIQRIKSEQD